MFYMIIMGILSLCVAIFAVQNAVSVEVSFLFWHFSMSLALIIIGSLLIGLVLSGLIALKVKAGHFMKERRLKGQIKALEEENAENRRKMGTVPHFKAAEFSRSQYLLRAWNPARRCGSYQCYRGLWDCHQ